MENVIGQRIERARNRHSLTLRELGERIGKSHTAVRKYERGELTPDSSILGRLGDALDLPVEYFLRPIRIEVQVEGFRTDFDLSEGEYKRILSEIEEKAERFLELLDLYPNSPVDQFAVPDEIPDDIETLDEIEHVAEHLRDAWELGRNAVPNLLDELESHGILVFLLEYDGRSRVDGLSARVDSRPIIGLGPGWPGDRQRFTTAHELGHIVLEGRLGPEVDIEDACNRFAGALLAPRSEVRKHLGEQRETLEPRELYQLKHKYGLSMTGWLHRAEELGIVTSATHDRLRAAFDDRGWDEDEPGGDYPTEQPTLFEELVYRAFSQDVVGESKAAELLGLSPDDFYQQRTMQNE
jgi:Zn-dependent peptidase ImmA (M78 family)/DNA-binding XRE family transcriptional regulator